MAVQSVIQYSSGRLWTCNTERRNSAQRTAGDAEAEDIVEILNPLDNAGVLQSVKFVAADYCSLPRYVPEDINVSALAVRQILTDSMCCSSCS